MNEVKKPAFEFIKFKFPNFSFNESGSSEHNLNMRIQPSGIYNEKDSTFELKLIFEAFEVTDEQSKNIVTATIISSFKFINVSKIEDIPTYFYRNSIAIVYPYFRSFIASLTLQANIKLVMLPIMNLEFLEEPLKKSIVVVK